MQRNVCHNWDQISIDTFRRQKYWRITSRELCDQLSDQIKKFQEIFHAAATRKPLVRFNVHEMTSKQILTAQSLEKVFPILFKKRP